jgi:hypothetical protein
LRLHSSNYATTRIRKYEVTKTKPPACIFAGGRLFYVKSFYFFLRLIKPAAMDPKPNRPRSGSGEAVCGNFCPASAVVAALLSAGAAFWSAVALAAGAAFWSVPGVVLAGGFCAVVEGAAVALCSVVLGAAALEAAAFWSVVLGAGAVLLGAAALSVVLGVLGVCAGGFTGALALSEDEPAGLLVVAAGAFALFGSVVGVWLDGVVEAAFWSEDVLGAAELEALLLGAAVVAASEAAGDAAPELEA